MPSSKGRPSKITLESFYVYIESLERQREERKNHFKLELTTMLDNKHKSLENKILSLGSEFQGMKDEIQEIEHTKRAMVKENDTLKSDIKNLKEQLHNTSTINNPKNKLDIIPIKEEINKLIVLDHERNIAKPTEMVMEHR